MSQDTALGRLHSNEDECKKLPQELAISYPPMQTRHRDTCTIRSISSQAYAGTGKTVSSDLFQILTAVS
ncbi:hypothetical protein CHU98_g10473 [Xylaria longipes]|nr:hypothetical protein CHU98_g10473 [Xylaria longipes]